LGEYFITLTVPANTPFERAVSLDVVVEGDVLSEVAYLLPVGWCGIPRFAIFYGIKQVYPETGGEWITGDGMYRSRRINWPLPEPKCKLTIKMYNPDDTYDHTLYLWLSTETVEEAKPFKVLADFIAILRRLIGV
jgi:hypothetical protein